MKVTKPWPTGVVRSCIHDNDRTPPLYSGSYFLIYEMTIRPQEAMPPFEILQSTATASSLLMKDMTDCSENKIIGGSELRFFFKKKNVS